MSRSAARFILVAGAIAVAVTGPRSVAAAAGATPAAAPSAPVSIGWSQFQGGPEHAGTASASVQAPLQQAWKAPAPGKPGPGASGAVIAGDVAVAVSADSVFAVNVSTGTAAWPQIARAHGSISMPAIGTVGRRDVLVYTEGDTTSTAAVVAVDLADRSELWRQSLKAVSGSGVTISDGEVFLGDRNGNLYAFSLADGSAASWSPMGLGGGSIDALPAATSTAVVVTERNHDTGAVRVDAVDPTSGNGLWSFTTSVSAGTATAPTLDDRNAIFGVGGEQRVRAFALASRGTADTVWLAHTRSTFSPLSSAAEAGGKVFIVSTSASDAALYALNASDGTKLWDFQFQDAAIETSPIVIGSTVYVGTDTGHVAGIDIPSGILIWQGDTGPGAIGPLAASNDELIAGKRGSHGGLVAFRTDPTGARLHVESPTKLHLGTVLVRYVIALIAVFAVVYGGVVALRRTRPTLGAPPGDDQADAPTPAETEEP